MDTQQAQQLAAEAERLVEQLYAMWCEARAAKQYQEAARIITIRGQAVARWARRYHSWSIAAYGQGVN
jgi:outer membrane murein-binding lipoprotein Lpp